MQDISLQGRDVLQAFDLAKEAEGVMRGIVKEFTGIEVKSDLTLELSATQGQTLISGIELVRQN